MKISKFSKLFLVTALILFVAFFSVACSQGRDPVTPETFSELALEKGFSVLDNTDQFTNGTVTNASVAMKGEYTVELYTFVKDSQATTAFNANLVTLKAQGAQTPQDGKEPKPSDERSGDNAQEAFYERITETDYQLIVRVKETVLFVVAPIAEREVVEALVKEMGYNF